MEINESKINELFTSWLNLGEAEKTAFAYQIRGYALSSEANAMPKKKPVGRPKGSRKALGKGILAEVQAE